ncbi:hypothetical protein M3Y97_00361200 [Aphelenchoides bicaudatus]|nr:hypothetical protein M3Y97_00361200 [Aphelenchoides bicaudatus]
MRQFETAKILCDHGANVNQVDSRGKTFISKAIEAGCVEACEFLVDNNAEINYINETTGETLIHTLAKSASVENKIEEWSKRNINLFDLNARDKQGRTALIVAIAHKNRAIFDLLINQEKVNVNILDSKGHSALEVALFEAKDLEMAEELVSKGAHVDFKDSNGNTLLHLTIQQNDFSVIQFLSRHKIGVNVKNKKGTSALHSFLFNLPLHGRINDQQTDILKVMLKSGGDLALVDDASGQNLIHFAVHRDQTVLNCILQTTNGKLPLDVLDQEGRSPLWSALTAGKLEAAQSLVNAGADVNEAGGEQDPLLIRAINLKRDDIVQFLLQNRCDNNAKTKDGCGAFNLAVENGLTSTVHELCRQGTNLDAIDPRNGFVPLWIALVNEDYGTAQVLIGHGCDLEAWGKSAESNNIEETLLHKAIDERNANIAKFLIKNGCDVNATRKYTAPYNETPLQMSVKWGLSEVTKLLISNLKCKTDAQDAEGRTAAHICILEQDHQTLDLLLGHPNPASCFMLRDKYGQTPLLLSPSADVNGNGENLLHWAVKANDFESVLFLLGLQIDVNIAVNDQSRRTPLHIYAEFGNSEIILRNLLVAGADINEKDSNGRTSLFIAASNNKTDVCQILLENNADSNLTDNEGNTCLHAAVSHGSIKTVELLLNDSDVNVLAVNNLQRNALHLTANVPGILGAELFQTIIEQQPNYPLEHTDVYGNTVFLLAFINGNEDLCRLALKYNVCLGTSNHQGDTIFRINTPTKQLLFGLLSTLDREPKWSEGEFCTECESKFTLTMRKHHCRHCGRLICQKCSEQTPIIKYNLTKPVRVCLICYEVLSVGAKELND